MKFFLSQSFLKPAKALYLWLIALCIGAIFCSGAFVASVIFNAENFGVNLARFEAGALMSAIFAKLNILLLILAFVMTFYEILSAKLATLARFHKILLGISSAISVLCIFLFALYFSPKIIALQKLGESATQSDEFLTLHAQSEWIFHILFFTLTFNLIYRIVRN
ncbi:DUF4149 domain-containing protein [Helicobacter sp. 23-1045]